MTLFDMASYISLHIFKIINKTTECLSEGLSPNMFSSLEIILNIATVLNCPPITILVNFVKWPVMELIMTSVMGSVTGSVIG